MENRQKLDLQVVRPGVGTVVIEIDAELGKQRAYKARGALGSRLV